MSKQVVLKLDGNLKDGFRTTLEIGSGSDRQLEIRGDLPPNPKLAAELKGHWKHKYRNLSAPYRRQQLAAKLQDYWGDIDWDNIAVSLVMTEAISLPIVWKFFCYKFRSLSAPYRIQPISIVYDEEIDRKRQDCQDSASQLGDLFRSWLDSPEFRRLDRCLRDELNRNKLVRFNIRTDDPQLQKLPWHLWDAIEFRVAEVALSSLDYQPLSPNPSPSVSKNKVRILAVLGHSEGIDVEADRQFLASLPDAEVVFLVEPTRQDFSDKLWEQSWDILFFAGHSQTEGETGRIYLNPLDEGLTLSELWYGLRQAVKRGLKLAIFNSCDGLGLARKLDDALIPYMVVMRELVPDRVAQTFLKYFLSAFASGKPFELAVRQGREQLQGLEDEFPCASWLPTIVQHPRARPLNWEKLCDRPPITIEGSDSFSEKSIQLGCVTILALSMAVTVSMLGVRSLGWLQGWELKVYDRLMRLRPSEGFDPRLLMVEATEEDINRYGFPLPDKVLAAAIEQLQKHQPRTIGLDIFRDRPVGPGHDRLLGHLQQSDRLITLCSIGQRNNPNYPGIKPPPGVPKTRQGFSEMWLDGDGVLRRHVMFAHSDYTDACATPHSFASSIALHYLKQEGITAETLSRDRVQIGDTVFQRLQRQTGPYQNLDDRGFQVLLNYRPGEVAQRVGITDIIQGKFDPDGVKNRIVLMGVTAPISNATDYFGTPYSAQGESYQELAGVQVQAQATSHILSAVLDDRPLLRVWSPWGDALWIGSWAIVGGVLVWRCRRIGVAALATGAAVGVLYGVSWGLLIQGQWIPLVPSALALVATGGGAMAVKSYQLSVISYQLSVNSGQLSVDSEQ